jgi:hypothetical protein
MNQAHKGKIIFCGVRGVFVEMSDLAQLFIQIA